MDINSPGVYVHVPFCRTKCAYCDFYSVTGLPVSGPSSDTAGRFIRGAETEAGLSGLEISGPAGSLYVGGGTPSVIAPELVSELPGIVSRSHGLEDGAEVTVEVNPDDVTPEALETYLGGGFNRISIGVQSFDDRELEYLGRRHDAAGAEAAIETARGSGFKRIGIDLIFGLAGQTLEGWRGSLERALDFGPEHISCYQLTLEPGTPMGERMLAGEAVCACEEVQREMFLETSRVLSGGGYVHYEVSNFARRDQETPSGDENYSRHNMRYWLRSPYLGLGPAAHSFDGRARRWNHRSVERWLADLDEGKRPLAGEEILSEEMVRAEKLMLGFRTDLGVETSLLMERSGWEETLEELLELSMVRIEGGRVIPTVEGFLVADQLPLLFM
jgi:putative oxygen-independent coproporphyrinogen III oxidase